MQKTKKGAASLYVVVFATILFGVITVSFARIILSEASQSSNDDLSRSAYDAALAGVEDAKIMVNRYYNCLEHPSSGVDCEREFNVFSDESKTDCTDGFPLARKMHGVDDGEVLIQETSINDDSETAADQAYTCVLISDVVPDYRGTLTQDTRTKVIPININGAGSSNNVLSKVKTIEFSWFSELNQGDNNENRFKLAPGETLRTNDNRTIPPTISLRLIKTGPQISLAEMHNENNTGSVVDSSMLLLPSDAATSTLEIGRAALKNAGDAYNGESSNNHVPLKVECKTGREFACVAKLDVAGMFGANDNVFLVASLPYADAFTDFAVRLLDGNEVIKLHGVQVSVDSTGRTNQLVRRVETRLDPADMFFPYPQYALELSGGEGDHALNKNFWITANCWYSTPKTSASLDAGVCANNGTL